MDFVVLAFDADPLRFFRLRPGADVEQLLPVDDLRADEPALQVGVDDARTLGRLTFGSSGSALLVSVEQLGSPPVAIGFQRYALRGELAWTGADGSTVGAAVGAEFLRAENDLYSRVRPAWQIAFKKPLPHDFELRGTYCGRFEDVDSDEKPDLSYAAKAREGQIPDDAMYRAMKSMKPSLYAYKPGFRPPEQTPGEVQAGPMANPMKKDPIAGLAVEQEPQTGLLAIDKDKALKLTMGSLAVLANDVEALKRKKGARK